MHGHMSMCMCVYAHIVNRASHYSGSEDGEAIDRTNPFQPQACIISVTFNVLAMPQSAQSHTLICTTYMVVQYRTQSDGIHLTDGT